jgi:hypothetical protein
MAEKPRRFATRALGALWAALIAFPVPAYAGEVAARPVEPADSLAELARRYDSSACRECHPKIFEQWERSHHARPLMGLGDQIFMSKYLAQGPLAVPAGENAGQRNFPCLKCHLPQYAEASEAALAELGRAIAGGDKQSVRRLAIGCMVCHQSKAVVHGRPEPGVIYGTRDLPDHPGLPVKKSPLLRNALMCGQCHGLGPVLDSEIPVQCAMLYGSYLHAYVPSGGSQTCQDCHMPGGDHYLPPNFDNREETSLRLKKALPLEARVNAYSFQPKEGDYFPKVVLTTKISSQAGHRIPDG